MINAASTALDELLEPPKFIAIEGTIGVGKTTLAKRLASTFNYEILLEGADENPFLERFYQSPKQAALQTQLFFLFQRAEQMQALRQNDLFQPVRVAVFLMEKDKLFARITLTDEEYRLYDQVYQHLTINAPTPYLVIYLQAPIEVLLQRIQKRGSPAEKHIRREYLQQLDAAYSRLFHYYNDSPILIVNAAKIDLVDKTDINEHDRKDSDYETLVKTILDTKNGRHYFNPARE